MIKTGRQHPVSLVRNALSLMLVATCSVWAQDAANNYQASPPVSNNSQKVTMPVSINALMVTSIDHSAHYIWDYGAASEGRPLTENEWRIVEYYAVQLGAAGPMITLGGTGKFDDAWSSNPQWIRYANDLSNAAKATLAAVKIKDSAALVAAGDQMVTNCEGCHNVFKPDTPTEGFVHNPEYDHLYHLRSPQKIKAE